MTMVRADTLARKTRISRWARLFRLLGSAIDPRVWAHIVKLVNYYNYSHVQPRRKLRPGPGGAISPKALFTHPERIEIGTRVRISARCHIWAGPSKGRIVLGDDVIIAPEVMITAANYRFNDGHPVNDQLMDEADVLVGKDVWIGYGAVILPGAQIGDGAIIGAGTVIHGRVEPNAIVSASPASQQVGQRFITSEALSLNGTGVNVDAAKTVVLETPQISPVHRSGPLHQSGIDSFDLLTLRTAVETATGVNIPDVEWGAIRSLEDIARLPSLVDAPTSSIVSTPRTAITASGAPPSNQAPFPAMQAPTANSKSCSAIDPPPPPPPIPEDRLTQLTHKLPPGTPASMVDIRQPGMIHRRHMLEMSKMAQAGMGEPWLFRELNDLHWALTCDFLQTPSSQVTDELGDRLYATITRCRLEFTPSLFHFKENTPLDIHSRLERFGPSVFFSQNSFKGPANVCGHVTVMSTFSKYGERGKNTSLLKSAPTLPIPEAVPPMEKISEFGFEYRARRAEPASETVLFETEYEIMAPYDINGVGLLYFAAYPTIYDLCIERYEGKGFLLSHSTRSKDLFYFANSEPHETLIFRLHDRKDINDGLIQHKCSLFRKSDGVRMGELIGVKLKIQ